MKLASITCYKQPDYVRALTLRTAAQRIPSIETVVLKNRQLGLLRYPEVIFRLLALRLQQHPDAYLVTFRGYEILPFVSVLTWPKPIIYDELINPLEWLHERGESWAKFVPVPLLERFYHLLLKRCRVIIADTAAHARSSAALARIEPGRFAVIPVSTDETLFHPSQSLEHLNRPMGDKRFQVFFYSNMRPLHGLQYILAAAIKLKHLPISFLIVGGHEATRATIDQAIAAGAHIDYRPWIDFKQLPEVIRESNVCLGGPFADTPQARQVITGKTYQFLACAQPTIVGDSEVAELFHDKENSLVVPLGDSEALAQAIDWAYRHPDELWAIGRRGQQLYEREFSEETVLSELQQVINRLV